jgi:hypothetical protein
MVKRLVSVPNITSESSPTDERAAKNEERLMRVVAPLVAHRKPPVRCNHEIIRSTTKRYCPSRSLLSTHFLAIYVWRVTIRGSGWRRCRFTILEILCGLALGGGVIVVVRASALW